MYKVLTIWIFDEYLKLFSKKVTLTNRHNLWQANIFCAINYRILCVCVWCVCVMCVCGVCMYTCDEKCHRAFFLPDCRRRRRRYSSVLEWLRRGCVTVTSKKDTDISLDWQLYEWSACLLVIYRDAAVDLSFFDGPSLCYVALLYDSNQNILLLNTDLYPPKRFIWVMEVTSALLKLFLFKSSRYINVFGERFSI